MLFMGKWFWLGSNLHWPWHCSTEWFAQYYEKPVGWNHWWFPPCSNETPPKRTQAIFEASCTLISAYKTTHKLLLASNWNAFSRSFFQNSRVFFLDFSFSFLRCKYREDRKILEKHGFTQETRTSGCHRHLVRDQMAKTAKLHFFTVKAGEDAKQSMLGSYYSTIRFKKFRLKSEERQSNLARGQN